MYAFSSIGAGSESQAAERSNKLNCSGWPNVAPASQGKYGREISSRPMPPDLGGSLWIRDVALAANGLYTWIVYLPWANRVFL